MLISKIIQVTSATPLCRGEDTEIATLNFDSRKSSNSPAELFIALPGTHHDGHFFIPNLYGSGIRNFLVSKKISIEGMIQCNVLQVEDCLKALQQIATTHRSGFKIPVVGITGSNGKTIVKEWLSTLLASQWNVVKSPKSYNSQLGVPLSVWQLAPVHELAVFEAGTSMQGEMDRLEKIIRPTLGIFTTIGPAHDEGFRDLEEKVTEKARLFADSKQVICRLDHHLIVETLSRMTGAEVITWAIDDPLATLNYQKADQHYQAAYNGKIIDLRIRLTNPYDLENMLHAVSMAIVLGEEAAKIQAAIDTISPIPMRLVLKRGMNDTFILDDTYNNDLQGLKIALDYLLQQPRKEKKTVILSDILQSGKSHQDLYQAVNALLERHQVTRLIGVGTEISKANFTIPADFYPSTEALITHAPSFAEELILVKGAREFGLEKVVSFLEEKSHGTVLEVNFEALTYNLNVYRRLLKPNVRLMVMVKAFAYGIGVEEIAHLLQYHRVDYLGVAYLDEAINLRRKGITTPVLILNPDWNSFPLLSSFALEPEIYSLGMLVRYLEDCPKPPAVHLKVESGMHRLGFEEEHLPELISVLKANPQLRIAGIFTHFSSAEMPAEDAYTKLQAEKFDKAYTSISDALGYRPVRHVLNSSGIVRWPEYQFDMVRLGIGLYGFDSSGEVNDLRRISTLKTTVSQIKTIKKGDTIGYSRKGKAGGDGRIATIAIGYADGYSRIFGNGNAYVITNNQRARTIGNICMDMTMVDVTGLKVKEGDEVIVFGEDPSISDLAAWAGTIPYEILTNVSQRVKRVFMSE